MRNLTGNVSALGAATSQLNTTYRDVNGRLRDAQGRFVAAGQAAREAGSGFSFAGGHLGKFSMNLMGLNAGLEIVQQVTGAIQGMAQQASDYAHQAEAARNAAKQWDTVLERFGINSKTAGDSMKSLSDRTGVNLESLKGLAAQYIKMGGTLEDFEKGALAAASSWNDLSVKSISLEESIGNVTLGLAQGRSELMESSGIVVNASQAWDKWAEANNRSVKSMTDAEKAHAYAIAVYKEEEIGISTLADRQTDLVKAENSAANSKKEIGKVIGEIILPFYTKYAQLGADVAARTLEIIKAFKGGEEGIQSLSDKYPLLVGGLQTALRVFGEVKATAQDVFERTIQPALERLAPKAQQMASVVQPTMNRLGAVLKDVAGTAKEAFERVLIPLFEAVAPVVMRIVQRVIPLIASLAEVFAERFKQIVAAWEYIVVPVLQAIAPYLSRLVDVIANTLGPLVEVVKNVFRMVERAISGDWKGAWDSAKNIVGNALLAIQTLIKGAVPLIGDILKSLGTVIDSKARELSDRFRKFGSDLADKVVSGFLNIKAGIQNAIADAIEGAISNLPPAVIEALKRLGIDLSGMVANVRGAAQTSQTTANEVGDTGFGRDVVSSAARARQDAQADRIVDYCAKWVRDALGDAAPAMRKQIDALFKMRDFNGNKIWDANDAANGMKAAGIYQKFNNKAELKPGDTVFYEDGGFGHVGIYIGNGMVRGNNRVTYAQNGGPVDSKGNPLDYSGKYNPVGDVALERLGRVTGYASAEAIAKYLKMPTTASQPAPRPSQPAITTPAAAPKVSNPSTPAASTNTGTPASTDGPVTAAMIARARELLATMEAAKKAAQAKPGDNALALAYDKAKTALESWTKASKAHVSALDSVRDTQAKTNQATGSYIPTLKDLKTYGDKALELYKALELAQKSGSAAAAASAQAIIDAWQDEDKVRKAVYDAEVSAYGVRKQNADKAAQDEKDRAKEQRQLRAQVADAKRQLTVSAAEQTLARITELNKRELDAFKGSAVQRQTIVERQAQDEYNAKEKLAAATREKAIRDAQNNTRLGAVVQGETIRQAKETYAQTLLVAKGAQDERLRQAKEGVKQEQQAMKGRADAELAASKKSSQNVVNAMLDRQKTLDKMADQSLADAKKSSQNIVNAMLAEERSIYTMQAEGYDTFAKGIQARAEELAKKGDWSGALQTLQDGLSRVFEAAQDGEDAGDAVDVLTGAINDLSDAYKRMRLEEEKATAAELALTEAVKANPARKPGSIASTETTQIGGPVEARRTREQPKLNPDGSVWVDPGVAARDPGATQRAEEWEKLMRAERIEAYKNSLDAMSTKQLEAAKSAAILTKDTARYEMIVAALNKRLQEQADLPSLTAQLDLNKLERDHAAGGMDEAWYVGEKMRLQIIKENADYAVRIKGKTADEIANLELEHQDNLKTIVANGAKGILDVEKEKSASILRINDLTAQGESQRLEARHQARTISEREYIAEREKLALEAAQRTFEAETNGLAEGEPKYKLAQAKLENARFAAAQEGVNARRALQQQEFQNLQANLGKAGDLFRKFTDGQDNAFSVATDYMSMNLKATTQAMQGDWAGAIMTTIEGIMNIGESIANLSPQFRAWKKNLLEIAALEKEMAGQRKYGNIANPYYEELNQDAANREKLANSKWYQRLGWSLFGGAPEVMSDEAAKLKTKAAQIFGDLASDLNSTLENSLMEGFASGDFSKVGAAFEKSINNFIAKQAITAAISAANIGPLIKAYADARAAGKDGEAELAALRAGLTQASQDAQTILKALPGFGAGGDPAEKARQTAEELRSIEEQQNELLYTKGEKTRADYEKEKLRLSLERIRLEGEAEVARAIAAGATEEEINRIRQRYNLQTQQEQANYDAQLKKQREQFAKDIENLQMNNAETALSIEEKLALGTAQTEEEKYRTQERFAQRRLELTRKRLEVERAAAIAEVDMAQEGAQAMLDAINAKYDLALKSAEADLTSLQNNFAQQQAEKMKQEAEKAAEQAKSTLESYRSALSGGIMALLNGEDNPLQKMYDGIRSRIAQAIEQGFVAKRIMARLDPLFEQLDAAITKGTDPSALIARIGAAMPSLAIELQTGLGPLLSALNANFPRLETALNNNTTALQEIKMMQTTTVQFRDVRGNSDDGRAPARLSRFTT